MTLKYEKVTNTVDLAEDVLMTPRSITVVTQHCHYSCILLKMQVDCDSDCKGLVLPFAIVLFAYKCATFVKGVICLERQVLENFS